mmetsp:Transcript_21660/g.69754  ORF Transcript_21660/g.69754 Transcript_21660/m.69754 type:complete len:205 (-) Transcript_21660:188-802(-)
MRSRSGMPLSPVSLSCARSTVSCRKASTASCRHASASASSSGCRIHCRSSREPMRLVTQWSSTPAREQKRFGSRACGSRLSALMAGASRRMNCFRSLRCSRWQPCSSSRATSDMPRTRAPSERAASTMDSSAPQWASASMPSSLDRSASRSVPENCARGSSVAATSMYSSSDRSFLGSPLVAASLTMKQRCGFIWTSRLSRLDS